MTKSRGRKIKVALFVIGGLLLVAAGFVVDLVSDAGGFRTVEPHYAGTCRRVEGIVGAEDGSKLSPSQVLRLTPPITADSALEEIYLDTGREISGSSVALPVGESRFPVGSVFERHFLDCRLDRHSRRAASQRSSG